MTSASGRAVTRMSDDELVHAMRGPRDGLPERMTSRGPPRCPGHLSAHAAKEWRRVARLLHGMGVLTAIDRAALAAYCQAWGRWAEAEERLKETPILIRTPSGYVQQSPWLGIANKQLELMGRYMTELGMTPASRSRVSVNGMPEPSRTLRIERVIVDAIPDAELERVALGPAGPDAERR